MKANVDFRNHYIRHAILRIWNKYKSRICPKLPLWLYLQEAYHRKEMTGNYNWIRYKDLLEYHQGDIRLKTREDLTSQGFKCHWFLYIQLSERFKVDKKLYEFERDKTIF